MTDKIKSRTAPRGSWLWGPAAVVTVVVAGLVPLLLTPDYYWRGDTEVAYFGAYYRLGEAVLQGEFPLMEPYAWAGGNHIVEGNFGLLSPLVMVIGVGATFVGNAIVYMTLVKLAYLGVAAAGNYLLARSYGAMKPLAFVVGTLVPLCGFTLYLDAPTWFPGLVVFGLLPLAWWALRGCLLHGWNPLLPLTIGWLLVTVGYVFGTLMLALVIGACIVDALRARRPGAVPKGVALGLLIGIPALVVRLPYLLSADVTTKSSFEISNDGGWVTDLGDLLTSTLPTDGVGAPLFYVAWLLPFLVFVDWQKARKNSRDLVGLMLVWVVAVAWALAPSDIGPLRVPMRLMPYVALCTVLLGALAFNRARHLQLSRNRLFLALFVTAFSAYITASATPQYWRVQAAVALIIAIGLVVLWLLLREVPITFPRRFTSIAAAFVGMWTIVVIGVQHHYAPETFASDRGMPGDISEYKSQLPAVVGDTFIVGRIDATVEPGSEREPLVLIANSWYVSGLRVQNVHRNTGHAAYGQRYCMNYLGAACEAALETLLSREPKTGLRRVDLLSVSSIVLLKSTFAERVTSHPPAGWHVADDSQMGVVWVRDDPVPPAGGVVWHTPGAGLVEESRDDESVRLSIEDVPAGGGQIVLSRIAWPGYQVSNATVIEPLDDYLLTLQLSPADANSEVVIQYAPPDWTLLLLALAAAIGGGLIWSVLSVFTSRAQRRPSIRAPD